MAKPIPACECNNKTSQKQPSMVALSESELNAAMQLIQLSISADSCSDHTDYHHQEEEEEEEEEEEDNSSNSSFLSFSVQQGKPKRLNKVDGSKGDVAASSTSSSSLAPVLMETEREEEEEEEGDDDDDRNNFGVRKNKRYRSVAELYRVTSETVLMSVVKGNKRKKEIECLRGLGSFKFLEEIDGAESRGC